MGAGPYYSRPGSGRSVRYPVSYHSPYRGTVEDRGRQYERYNYHAPQGVELYEYHYPDSDQYQSDSYHRTNIDPYHDPYYSDTDPVYFSNRGGAHYYSYRHGNTGARRSSDTRVHYNDGERTSGGETGGRDGPDDRENGIESCAADNIDEGQDEETTSSLESEESVEGSIRPHPLPPSSSSAGKHLKNRQLKTYNTVLGPSVRPEVPPHYFYRQNSYPKIRVHERQGHYHHPGVGPIPRDRRHSITYKHSQHPHLPPPDDHITVDV